MHTQTTSDATERSLRAPVCGIDVATGRTGLRAVRRRDLKQQPTGPGELVAQTFNQTSPTRIEYTARQTVFRAHHVSDLKLLNDDRAVAFGVGSAEILDGVFPLPTDLTVQPHDTGFGFFSVLGTFLSAGDGTLSARKALHRARIETGRFNYVAVAIGNEINDPPVKRHHGLSAGFGLWNINHAYDRGKPLIAFAAKRAGLGLTLQRSVCDRTQITKLRESKRRAVEAPHFRMGFACAQQVTSLTLEARLPRELLETTLPSLVKFNQQLRTDVARHVGQPGQRGSQLSQLDMLIERGVETTLIARTSEPQSSLFKREIPQEPQRTLPCEHTCNLRGIRIDTVAKSLINQHAKHNAPSDQRAQHLIYQLQIITNKPTRKRGVLPALNGGVYALVI